MIFHFHLQKIKMSNQMKVKGRLKEEKQGIIEKRQQQDI